MNTIRKTFSKTKVAPLNEVVVVPSDEEPKPLNYIELIKLVGLKETFLSSNTIMHMYYAPTAEIRERCKSTWGTMGVVSALLAGLSVIPPLTAQGTVGLSAGTDAWTSSPWLRALLYLSFLAFLCNITVIIWSTVFYIFIDHIFTDRDIVDFLQYFAISFGILPTVFGFSVMLVGAEVLAVIGYTCQSYDVWILMGLAGGMGLALIYATFHVMAWTGARCANLHFKKELGPRWVEKWKAR